MDAAPAPLSKKKRKRGGDSLARARFRRAFPREVDMGPITVHFSVRYDEETASYDLRDVLDVAYGGSGGGKRAMGTLRKGMFNGFDVTPARWATAASNKGRERILAKADACFALLNHLAKSSRTPTDVKVVASWIQDSAKEGGPDLHECGEARRAAVVDIRYEPRGR